MGFIWSTLNKGTDVTKDQITEVKDNINTLRTNIGLAPWSWVNVPVNVGNQIENPSIEEIRDALDLTHTENICSSDHLTYNNPAYTTQLTSENTSENGSNNCGQLCGIFWHPNYTVRNSVDNAEYLAALGGCGAVNSNVFITVQGNHLHYKYYVV